MKIVKKMIISFQLNIERFSTFGFRKIHIFNEQVALKIFYSTSKLKNKMTKVSSSSRQIHDHILASILTKKLSLQ